MDKGEGYKGTLTYTAEFVPAMALKNLAFGEESHPQGRADRTSVSSKKSSASNDLQSGTIQVTEPRAQAITSSPDALPHNADTNRGLSGYDVSDAAESDAVVHDEEPASEEKRDKEQGVEMSIEEALAQRACRLLLFELH